MQIRLLIATLMLLLAMAGKAQVFQPNNTPTNFARGLKARDLLIAPKGCDTTALSNPKWGESTAGALFVDTCNNRLYFYNGLKWNQVTGGGGGVDSFYYNFRNLNDTTLLWDRGDGTVDTLAFSSGGTSLIGSYVDSVTTVGDTLFYWKGGNSTFVTNLAAAAAGGDTTIFVPTVDSTGNDNFRVLYAKNNKITGVQAFRYSEVFNRLTINPYAVISSNYDTVRLSVDGAVLTGKYMALSGRFENNGGSGMTASNDSLKFTPTPSATDTSTYKPAALSSAGGLVRMGSWPITPSIDTTSLSNRINLKLNISDTAAMLSPYLKVADTVGTGSLYIRNQFAAQENKKFSVIQGEVDALDFNSTSSIADSTQRLTWDDGNGTLNIGLKGGQVNLAVGQEQVARVYNDAGVTLNDGDIVYITGAQGNRVKVQKAVNTDAAIAYATLGMVTETITAGSEGFVTILGTVNHLNTSSFAEGTELYLSGTAGGYTSTKPSYPAAIVSIGRVERSHATVGSIYVNVRSELPTVASYGKNAGGDSTVLLMTNGQRFAAKDSTGGGGSGVTTVGTFSGSSQTNGATISGSTITFGPADATNPGMVSTGAQTFAGQKTFNDAIRTPEPTTNTAIPSIYFRDAGAGSRMGIGRRGDLGSMQFFTYGGYRWYGGGDFNDAASDWMTLTSSALTLPSTTSLNLGSVLRTSGAASNTPQASIYLRDFTGAGNQIGIGRGIADVHFFGINTYGFRWYGGGQFNTGASNWAYLDEAGFALYGSNAASAALTVNSTTKGFLVPRMTTTQMNAISSPAAGLQLYNSTLSQPHYRDGSTWQAQVGMTFGTAAPTSTPTAVGNFFLDTTNKKLYVATGTASSADWTILN